MSQLLRDTPLRLARPETVVAGDPVVSWVHSSEIYEIAPLLDGGEVLLTTGLGLVGADDLALARYVEAIASRGAAAIALELGRTFVTVPSALTDACRQHDLALLALHAVVPFVRIARVANELLLDHEAQGLRRATSLASQCADALVHRRGLRSLVQLITDHVAADVRLDDAAGRMLAGVDEIDAPQVVQQIYHDGNSLGRLVAHDRGDPHLAVLLAHASDALRLALTDVGAPGHRDAHALLVTDLVRGVHHGPDEIAQRAAGLGIPLDRAAAGVVVVPSARLRPHLQADRLHRELARHVRVDLFASVGDRLVAVVDAGIDGRQAATRVTAAVDDAIADLPGRLQHVAIGPAVPRLDRISESLRAASLAVDTAVELGMQQRLLFPIDTALYRFLFESDDSSLERFVSRTLGPLLEHDAARSSALVLTLQTYLESGRSKAATAARLSVRRQTVHDRLERIRDMLDLPAHDAEAMTALEIALAAWRVRTAGHHGSE